MTFRCAIDMYSSQSVNQYKECKTVEVVIKGSGIDLNASGSLFHVACFLCVGFWRLVGCCIKMKKCCVEYLIDTGGWLRRYCRYGTAH